MDLNDIREKIGYLLMHMDDFVEEELYNILSDNENDLHHSAVAVNNLIICMRDVEKWLCGTSGYSDLRKFMEDAMFSREEIDLVLGRKEEEAKIYTGRQF